MDSIDDYECSFPRCKKPLEIIYLNHANVCKDCWAKLCEAYDKGRTQENRLLKKIGLVRNKEGEVVFIDPDENDGVDEMPDV